MPNTVSLWRSLALRAVAFSVVLASMLVAYVAIGGVIRPRLSAASVPTLANVKRGSSTTPENPFAAADGKNLIAFVLTASDCGWASRPTAIQAVSGLRAGLRSAYGASYSQVRVVGVVLDDSVAAGLRFLARLDAGKPGGAFDQISVGGSWLNEEAVRLIWREKLAKGSTPQIVLIERPVNTRSFLATSQISVGEDHVVVDVSGTKQILAWIHGGMRLDGDLRSGKTP